jgi:hypothetical protein
MATDWPKRFKQFSLAVDVIEDDVFETIESTVKNFFTNVLTCHYYRVMIDGIWTETEEGEAIPALSTVWSSDPEKKASTVPIRAPSKTRRQAVLSYALRKPLWIIAKGGMELNETRGKPDSLTDTWSAVDNLPEYRIVGDRRSKTSIMVPLEYGDRVFGVIILEFERLIPISQKAKDNAQMIADAIGRIIWIWKTTETQLGGTRDALEELKNTTSSIVSPIGRRTVFVSSSDEADQAVMKIILSVLEEFEHIFKPIYWKYEQASGNINDQVRSGIAGCDFGICYFSEPTTENVPGGHAYQDNPNVLFEAGMMQMLHEFRDRHDALTSRWIPIREDHEEPPPFNFAGDRIVVIPRIKGTGELDGEKFTQMLRSTVTELVERLGLE